MAWYRSRKKQSGGGEPVIVSDLIPRMTSDTEPSGECYANYVYSGRYAWYGFATTDCGKGANARTFWYNNGGAANNYIQYDFKKIVTIYRVYFGSIENGSFTNRHIKFQVSSDGETWIDDKTITIDTWEWMPYDFISPKTCRYLRLVCTDAMEYAISGIQAQGYVGDTLPETIILGGTANPTSAQGSNGQLYLKYGEDPDYVYDEDLGGYVLNDYYIHDQGTYLATQSAAFYKTYDGGAITVYWNVSPWYGPIVISTVADNVRFSSNAIGGSVVIDGVTWYISTNEAWSQVYDQNHAFPILEANYVPNDSDANRRKAVEDILTASDYQTQLSSTIIGSTFAKVGGSWQSLVGTDVGDISNVTADTVSIYKGSTVPSSSLGADGNVYFQYGVLDAALLHFEDSATTDEFNNTTWTAEGSATISADQHKFGSKSLYLNGSGYLRSPVGDDMFNFGSGDFTVSCWIYPLFATRYPLFAMSTDCRIGCDLFFQQGSANMWLGANGGNWNIINSDGGGNGIGTIAINANEWTHIAYIRKGDTCKMFVNGQLAKATDIAEGTSVYWSGNDSFQVGKWGGPMDMFNGYIDELLILKGAAYWDSAFTPPTQPFSLSDFTNVVVDTYAKDNGSWQSLKGTPIDDIAGTVEPT